MAGQRHHIVFYDGVCGLCDRVVRFLMDRDRGARLRYAPLQGRLAGRELRARGARPEDLDTIYVLTSDGHLLHKSRAVLFLLRQLGPGWRALALLRVLPTFVTDVVYNLVARVRYRFFGRFDACRVPTAAERQWLLEDPEERS